jgi:hypothetical protein
MLLKGYYGRADGLIGHGRPDGRHHVAPAAPPLVREADGALDWIRTSAAGIRADEEMTAEAGKMKALSSRATLAGLPSGMPAAIAASTGDCAGSGNRPLQQ